MIPYGKQSIEQSDIDAVVSVLKSDWLTQGPKVPAFEQALCGYTSANYAVAVNSATSALHIACLALGVGKQDTVWTSPNSFVASANCALYCGAQVDFVDIDIETGNMSVDSLASKLALAEQQNKLPKVIIPVHFAGQSCDMKAIYALSKQYGFNVIEDASHAVGGCYQGEKVGNCKYSDICIFSFHPVKIITSAEGGVALTNDKNLAQQLSKLRSHGITSDQSEFTEPSHGVWYYQQQALGYNYRMTDIHAALGISQLGRVDEFVQKRNQLATRYDELFANNPSVTPLKVATDTYSAYHLYVVKVHNSNPELHRHLIAELRERGICGHVHYIPIYLQPYYQQLGFAKGYCKNTEAYYHSAVTLPLYPKLAENNITALVSTLLDLLKKV
ncbi:UDP-4-amino-4,6-dideoxy-N-acetyl-beta-L-altrosamine transaminase [Pseudoalteromonas 'SMAR']|uniref:UDP-4-amino-4, 6-dideoxy-N-acetyl-beta-L-altrosamine transaminase n=1 Tax=Pseudoalteromonas 'SMAR' TaxID=3416908 RepID=UPI003AF274D2